MKTYKMELAFLALFIAGTMVSCNQSANNNRDEKVEVDTVEIIHLYKIRQNDARSHYRQEMDRIRLRWDSLDEKDPNFNRNLDAEIDRLNADLDTMNYRFQQDNVDIDDDWNSRNDSLRRKSAELKDKIERWTNKTGENLEELGKDIKRNFNEFKESLKDDNN